MKKYLEPNLSFSYFKDEDVMVASSGTNEDIPTIGDNGLPWVDIV